MKAIGKQRLEHHTQSLRRCPGPGLGKDIEPVVIEPVRPSEYFIGRDVVCRPDQVEHGGFPYFVPVAVEESALHPVRAVSRLIITRTGHPDIGGVKRWS
jgi:hypothetical protein